MDKPPPQPLALALDDAFIALVKVLHLTGSMDVADLTKEIGDAIDFRRQSSDYQGDRQLDFLVMLHGRLLQLEPLLAQLRSARSATPPDGA